MNEPAPNREERFFYWLSLVEGHPPEWLASYVQSPKASWSVVVEDGPEIDRHLYSAFLDDANDLPYWAFALAKAYLDDVDEWPLYGMKAEAALDAYEEHGDPLQAVHQILAAVLPVWPEVRVIFAGTHKS